jgi:hypothetical protein
VNPILAAAERSIARASGFAGLAIMLVLAGLSFEPLLALRSGAALALILWASLKIQALRAPRFPYKRTETWLIVEPRPALPDAVAQRLVAEARRQVSERYARYALMAALVMWLVSLVARLAGLD